MTSPRLRLLMAGVLLIVVAVVALTMPVPSPLQMRTWAQSVGTVAPVLSCSGTPW